MTNPIDQLVDQLATRHAAVVRAQPGDTLVLLMPDDPDADGVDQLVDGEGGTRPAGPSNTQTMMAALTEALPNVGVIAVIGAAGAVVVPPGGYVAEPDPVIPLPDPTPAYVHALVDALLSGEPLDFAGQPVPADVERRIAVHLGSLPSDVQQRLAGASGHSAPTVPGSITSPGGWCKPAADSSPSTGA